MNNWKNDNLRTWIFGTAATGLLWHSFPGFVNADTPVTVSPAKLSSKLITAKSAQSQGVADVRANGKSERNSIRLVSQNVTTNGDKSEVQKQLEALYQQDGREMPNMNFNLQPITPGSVPGGVPPQQQSASQPGRQAPGYTQYQPNPQNSAYASPNSAQGYGAASGPQNIPQAKPRQASVLGMLKKITAGNKQSAATTNQPPIPPDFYNTPPAPPAQNAANYNKVAPVLAQQPAVRYPDTQRINTQAAPSVIRTTTAPTQQPIARTVSTPPQQTPTSVSPPSAPGVSSITASTSQAPQNIPAMPPLSDQPLPLQSVAGQNSATETPRLISVPRPQPQTMVENNEVKQPQLRSQQQLITDDFPNPFIDDVEPSIETRSGTLPKATVPAPKMVSLSSVSKGSTSTSSKPEVRVTPKVEVASQEPQHLENNVKTEPNPIGVSDSSDNPFAVDGRNFVEPIIVDEDQSTIDPTAPSLEIQVVPPAPPGDEVKPTTKPLEQEIAPQTEETAVETKNEPKDEKVQKIHERIGMKGLKGFCPVALRDQRELVDAKPEFHVTHRRQKFHFSSAAARDKFEAHPLRYKPAAYGADVVALSRDKEVVEGSLDFAARYNGRLFLFGSQENYETFINDPTQFATIEGIE